MYLYRMLTLRPKYLLVLPLSKLLFVDVFIEDIFLLAIFLELFFKRYLVEKDANIALRVN